MPKGARKRYNSWRSAQQKLVRRQTESRYIREIIFGQRRKVRYYQISKRDVPDPSGDESWYIMTNLSGDISLKVAPLYSLRNWIEYGFKQVKDELGWAHYRLTDYESIERWWEIVMSAYLLVSIQANYFRLETVKRTENNARSEHFSETSLVQFQQHPWWEKEISWKSTLNNLRLILQPYIFNRLLEPWLQVFPIPGLKRCFLKLISSINQFQGFCGFQTFFENPPNACAC